MAEPVTIPIETDPEELVEIARDYLRNEFPEWNPERGDQVDWLLRACAYIVAELRDTASEVPVAIFSYLGRWLVQLPEIASSAASTTATVTAVDNAGYTIPEGSRFRALTTGDGGVVLYATEDITILPGATTTATGEVPLVAEEEGAQGNFTAGTAGEPLDSLPWITGIEFEDSMGTPIGASGGVDEEDPDAYLARLVDEMRLLSPTPILPPDLPPLVRSVAGVGRCLPVNLYDPDTDTYDNEKTMTAVIVDSLGGNPSAPLKAAVKALLESLREVNFVFHVVGPTYTQIDVEYEVTAYPGVDKVVLKSSCDAAVIAHYDNLNWGRRPQVGDDAALDWEEADVARYGELYEVLNGVGGVSYVDSAKIALTGDAVSEQDIALDGPGAMPTLVGLTGTVN